MPSIKEIQANSYCNKGMLPWIVVALGSALKAGDNNQTNWNGQHLWKKIIKERQPKKNKPKVKKKEFKKLNQEKKNKSQRRKKTG